MIFATPWRIQYLPLGPGQLRTIHQDQFLLWDLNPQL
jgi:hypothetical protein